MTQEQIRVEPYRWKVNLRFRKYLVEQLQILTNSQFNTLYEELNRFFLIHFSAPGLL